MPYRLGEGYFRFRSPGPMQARGARRGRPLAGLHFSTGER